jgi:Na+/melibiose symporter-like transporter
MTRQVRVARVVVALVFFINGAGFAAWAARIPAVRERLELSEATLGLALAVIAVGSLVSMSLSGWLSARFGSRRTTRGYLAAFGIAVALLGIAPSLPMLLLVALFAGAAMGGLDVAMNTHGVAVERRYDRPILSSFHAAFSLGALAGAAISAVVAGLGVDVRAHLVGAGLIVLAVGLPATRALLPAGADAREPGAPAFARPPRALLAIGVIAFAGLLAEGAAADWSALYVTDSLGASAATGALVFAGFQLTMTACRLVGDRVTAAVGPVALVRGGGLVAAAGLGAALLLAHPVAAFAGFACLGIGLAVVFPVALRSATQQPGLAPGPALAAVSTMGYLGFLVGPPLIGGLASVTSLSAALTFVVALTLLQAALAGSARGGRVPAPAATEAVPA